MGGGVHMKMGKSLLLIRVHTKGVVRQYASKKGS